MKNPGTKRETGRRMSEIVELPGEELLNQWLTGSISLSTDDRIKQSQRLSCYDRYSVYIKHADSCR